MVKIINYDHRYEINIIDLWNRTLTADSINPSFFRKQILFDDNFQDDLCLLAIDDEKLVGFILGIKRVYPYLDRGLEPDRGWISVIFVDPEYQRKGIGSTLVDELENRLINKGVKRINVASYSPGYFFPGVDIKAYKDSITFFEKKNYVGLGEAVSMERSLFDHRLSDEFYNRKKIAESNGFKFTRFTYNRSFELLKFLQDNFGGGWKYNALTAIRNQFAEDTIWLALDSEDHIVGFCMRRMDGNDNRFGPFGVLESLRSHGLGYILFELMMNDMKERRLYYLFFLWTGGAGMKFYLRHGVNIYRTYQLFEKRV